MRADDVRDGGVMDGGAPCSQRVRACAHVCVLVCF